MITQDFHTALNAFLKVAQELIIENHTKQGFTNFEPAKLSVDPKGQKYIRIIRTEMGDHRSVYCFIEKETGNVLKASGWKAPAKGIRSNIYADDHGLSGVTAYGAVYHK